MALSRHASAAREIRDNFAVELTAPFVLHFPGKPLGASAATAKAALSASSWAPRGSE